jgi:hypothetical protein
MKSSIRPPNSWPAWANPPITLYHGTLLSHAEAIAHTGVDPSKGRALTDFGRGFYATTDERAAWEWSNRKVERLGGEPSIVRMVVDRRALSRLDSIVFIRGSASAGEYWTFVRHCRAGMPHDPATGGYYDVAYGPVAKVWSIDRKSAVWADYDQISFHTRAAQDILNERRICTREILR